MARNAWWIAVWIIGSVIIGWIGRYGDGSKSWLPSWIDLLVVIVFSLLIYRLAVSETMSRQKVQEAIAKDSDQIDYVHAG
jgi:bacteriorhodopsin